MIRKLLNKMTKEDLIQLCVEGAFGFSAFTVYSLLHNRLMEKFKAHIDNPVSVKDWGKWQAYIKQGELIQKQFDDLEKTYNEIKGKKVSIQH